MTIYQYLTHPDVMAQEPEVRMSIGADGTPRVEAYITIRGQRMAMAYEHADVLTHEGRIGARLLDMVRVTRLKLDAKLK